MTVTFSLSLLFHLLFLLVLLSSNIVNKSYHERMHLPPSAIRVNIINVSNERALDMPAAEKVQKVEKVEKAQKEEKAKGVRLVKREPEPVKKKVAATKEVKKPEVVKTVPKAKEALPEPVTKEKAAVNPPSEVITQKPPQPAPPAPAKEEEKRGVTNAQNAEVLSPSKGNNKETAAVQGAQEAQKVEEARLAPAAPVVSGPVIDIPDFKYEYYLGVIRDKVDSRWSQPRRYSQIKQALIEFTIYRNGEISNVRIAESSGDYYFDQTALRAVSLSNPFPPLPRGYDEDSLKVRYRFIFGGKG